MNALPALTVRRADLRQPADLDAVVPLFDAYRRFYGREADLPGARAFLSDRAEHGESVVLVAHGAPHRASDLVGFTQLYPVFSSTAMARTFILNDLYVAEPARRIGAGRALLLAASAFAREAGALRLSLSTAVDNLAGQALYESTGWKRDSAFFSYQLPLR
jgi:GNAT superfamily N-acetyltransferase